MTARGEICFVFRSVRKHSALVDSAFVVSSRLLQPRPIVNSKDCATSDRSHAAAQPSQPKASGGSRAGQKIERSQKIDRTRYALHALS